MQPGAAWRDENDSSGIIYAGQGVLSDRVFRLSAMGEISSADLERLFDAFDAALK